MTASAAEVEAAQKAMGGCRKAARPDGGPWDRPEKPWCVRHAYEPWTDRGCPVAVAVADAVVAAAQPRIAAEVTRDHAALLAPFSGIGMGNGATRADISRWLRARADELEARS